MAFIPTRDEYEVMTGRQDYNAMLPYMECKNVGRPRHERCGVCEHGWPHILADKCPKCTNAPAMRRTAEQALEQALSQALQELP